MTIHQVSNPLKTVYAYHQATRHAFNAYAKGPAFLDWDSQPDPYRRFAGAPLLPLQLAADSPSVSYAELVGGQQPAATPLHIRSLALLLELAFGLSAVKQQGDARWDLRCNPSSGNLHPTEAYVLTTGMDGLLAGLYHYASHEHGLEQRCEAGLPVQGLWVGLSSVHWREAWKYGERAFRYCQHDVGHALGALRYAAAVLGWRVELEEALSDAAIAGLLGLDRQADFFADEAESPDLLCRILTDDTPGHSLAGSGVDALLSALSQGFWRGKANRLSAGHLDAWPIIEQVTEATRKPATPAVARVESPSSPHLLPEGQQSAASLIRQRRSAQAFDAGSYLSRSAFFSMLDATLPHHGQVPFDLWPWQPRVHLMLFVHRVTSIPPGVYLFFRSSEAVGQYLPELQGERVCQRCTDAPEHFELYLLAETGVVKTAKILSCYQSIAGDSAFSLGMLAEFDRVLAEDGAWAYRRLFWETGLIGQSLYLGAEAEGVRGTGIGCFFDGPVHEVVGIADTRLQSLYHFTVGTPVTDTRLQTLPAYAHLGQTRP